MAGNLKINLLTRSLWVFHLCAASCNNCDIEILDLLTPRHDVERFGILLAGSIKHADVLLVTGSVNRKNVSRIKKLYDEAPKPILVVAIGACACTGGIFRTGYQFAGPLDKIIPVDAYIPGCPPKPEAMIDGVVKLITKVKK
ncbi:MAG: NADH:ubiquinone oxidoreductase [bacterium (Candidatus Ratteibacteria) CG23_combo_of_CG06-09_8_20_14_all_48_7]|uniref:NADH:ubiquinone oxidoreductase n=1 Tax=bacterium (Candidatus Ratteibacteria) CG23_combo_of_CG06-09_8_20_14_all_48_7 TaxID=2014292 RepID=A0A2G9Y942_9BACT|nr:MAG: NADH:ubiquinone oxidoreductase [bacterium (Candidatus Ratteibacteria) CG23_combo_of_CG06-09_8_20_14_all_48_7]